MSYRKWLSFVLLLMMVFVFFTLPVYAKDDCSKDDASYSIKSYYSQVTLYKDGSGYFDEYITYKLLDDSPQLIKRFPMAFASDFESLEVFSCLITKDTTASETLVPLVDGEDYTCSLADEEQNIYDLTIGAEGNIKDELTFVYRYKLKDLVFLYKDTAAFFWQFILPEENINVENIDVKIILDVTQPLGEMKGFTTGSAYINKEILEDGTFWINVERLKPDEFLEIAFLMPNSLFPDGRKVIENYSKDEIISDMESWEQSAMDIRKNDEIKYYSGWAIGILSALLSLGAGVLLYLKANKVNRKDASAVGIIGLPVNIYTPAELGAFLNKGRLGVKDFVSTTLYLLHSNILEIEHDDLGGFIKLKDCIKADELKPHEEYIVNWLIKDVGNGQAISFEELEDVINSYNKKYKNKTETWYSLVSKKANRWNIWDNISKAKLTGIIIAFVGLIAGFITIFALDNLLPGILAVLFALALILYIIPLRKMTDFGNINYAQWMQFKEYIRELIRNRDTSLPLSKWESFLIYAIPLNIHKEVLSGIKANYAGVNFEDSSLILLHADNFKWLESIIEKI